MKALYNLLIQKIVEQMLTVLATAVKRGENQSHQKFTPIWLNALESEKKVM